MICRRAAEFISRSLDEPLSRLQRLDLGVHTLFCTPCRRFRKQLKQFHAECETSILDELLPGAGLSSEAKGRIATAFQHPPTN